MTVHTLELHRRRGAADTNVHDDDDDDDDDDVYDDDGGELPSAALAWLAKPQAEERREWQAG